MNSQFHSKSSAHSGATLGLSLLQAVSGCAMLGMLLLPAPLHASTKGPYSDGHGGASTGGLDAGQEDLDHGTGLSAGLGTVPFGDDTIGTLPIHCDDDAMAMDEIMASLAPVFFIEGKSSEIMNIVSDAVESPGATEPAQVFAIPGSVQGHWRVYFVGEVQLTLDRGRVADSKHRVKYGLFGTRAFGRGRIAYGGPGSGWSRPAALYAYTDHRVPLAELERNGLLVGAPTHVMTLSQARRSTTILQDTSAGLVVTLNP